MTGSSFDAIVVGAGYVGSSVAYHLCTAGLKTALFDQGSIAAGASAANFGNIQIQDMELTKSRELTNLGRSCFKNLEDELDWKIGLRRIGSLLPIENESQWKVLNARKERLNEFGIPAEIIPASHLQEIEPCLDSHAMLGGLYHEFEGQIDPFQLIWAYIVRARQKGLQEFYHTKVTGFQMEHDKILGIQTGAGAFSAKNVVLCTGAYTKQLGRTIHRNWNVHYVIGQSMVSELVAFIFRNHLSSAAFFEESAEAEKGRIIANMAISQSTHGNILIGESMFESEQFPQRVPARSLSAISDCWIKYFPALKKLRILRCWSAPVADVQDGLPMLGPVESVGGLFMATAFRSTVIITPLVGKTMAQLITSGKSELNIEHFSPERNLNETD
jgi:sarcosine oxidase subunit beta